MGTTVKKWLFIYKNIKNNKTCILLPCFPDKGYFEWKALKKLKLQGNTHWSCPFWIYCEIRAKKEILKKRKIIGLGLLDNTLLLLRYDMLSMLMERHIYIELV